MYLSIYYDLSLDVEVFSFNVSNIVSDLYTSCISISFILDTEIHPQIIGSPRIYPDVEDNRLVFKCEFNSSTKEEVARYNVSWFEESPLKQLSKVHILKGMERVAKLEIFPNSSHAGSQFRLGKTVGYMF